MSSRDFIDCELYLTGESVKLSAEVADVEAEVRFDEELEARLLDAKNHDDPLLYGQLLFEALFAGERLRAGYSDVLGRARHTDRQLRLRLHVAAVGSAAKLHAYDWEVLFDPWHRFALGCSSETAFSRYLSVDRPAPGPVEGVLRLLVVLPAPRGLAGTTLEPLDRDAMRRSIEASLEPLAGAVEVRVLEPPVTLSRIREHLVDFEAHALLLEGHGLLRRGEVAGLALEDDEGELAPCGEDDFADVFSDLRELRLVTLLACQSGVTSTVDPYSGLGPALVGRGVPAVVAMRRPIGLEVAGVFLRHFLLNLAGTGRVDAAVNEARMQLYTRNRKSWDWGAPTLFLRLRDARLWHDPPPGRSSIRRRRRQPRDDDWWSPILQDLKIRQLIPILGPGVIYGLLPSKAEVASILAEEQGFPWNGSARGDLPYVAQFVESKKGERFSVNRFREILRDRLLERQPIHGPLGLPDPQSASLSEVIEQIAERYFQGDPDESHHILAELPITNYFTTNIDNFMTAALRRVGNREPQRRHCLWHEDDREIDLTGKYGNLIGSLEKPLVFHLFGHDEAPVRYQVLTEDDHLDFLRMIAFDLRFRIPELLRESLKDSTLVFLGYQVADLDCRVLFRGLVKQLGLDRSSHNFTVWQFPESDRAREHDVKKFVEQCSTGPDTIYYGSARQFLTELRDRWRTTHGQR